MLRPYQSNIIAEARANMVAGIRSNLIISPTGSGKTVLTAHMLDSAEKKGMVAWFVVHRRELVKQSIKTFSRFGVKHGVVANSFPEAKRMAIQICSVQTLVKRYTHIRKPNLIVWDECHHSAAGSWRKIFEMFPDAYHIGLTATPERLDGKGLDEFFKCMVKGPAVKWLIENKYLVDYKMYAPAGISVSGVHMQMGDFNKKELSVAADKPRITGDAINHYKKLAFGKRAVVFCVSVEHSKHVVQQFNQAGIPAAHVDGETDAVERDNTIRRFEDGEIKILSNVELFGEGFDLPALEVVILLRPTQSLGLYLQQVGRALRPSPGKDFAIVLDHAGNCQRHGLPDEEREWSLTGRDRSRKGNSAGASVRVCPKCFAAQASGGAVCRFCAFVFAVAPREVDQVEGELKEVDVEAIRRQKKQEQARAQTLEELIELGKQRGMKRPHLWAKHVFNARQAKKLMRYAV